VISWLGRSPASALASLTLPCGPQDQVLFGQTKISCAKSYVKLSNWELFSTLTRRSKNQEVADAIDEIEKAGAQVKRNITLRRFSSEDDDMFTKIAGTLSKREIDAEHC
jgi:hypothetical protein